MNTAIEFENISKQYRLGLVSTGTLSHDLNRFWQTKVLRRDDPYLKVGETNDRAHKGNSDYVWALKDINFKVEQGDVVGIIGRNGAGKSTLLKLLSRVTAPTTGIIRAKGRIASLLEVGTGFHPEMTGRENIYMNGAIMGMSRSEITRKLDEIVDFSGCERYLDTPVKRYSSGMTVRLGFAIAAHLEPEILVVDEVLAVGDAEFQKKAIGKMQDVSRGEGRTVLFVSHNMESIKMLCSKGIVLQNGSIAMTGSAEDCVNHYINSLAIEKIVQRTVITAKHRENFSFLTKDIEFKEVAILNENPEAIANDEPLIFSTKLVHNHGSRNFQLCIFFQNVSDVRVVFCMTKTLSVPSGKKEFEVKVNIPYHSLPKGRYSVRMETNLQDFNTGSRHFDFVHHVLSFEIKYIHQIKKDEFLFWNSNFGETLLLEDSLKVQID
ncbi:MAG: ABC transporter ATP-binding protein [Fibrobacter sp.]|nr:ABC transporter ATP-binding protein [Fibrobacter sp.]